MTWWMVVLLACSGDDPAAGSPSTRGSDSQPGAVSTADSAPPSTSDSGDGDTGGSTDDSASTNTPTGATAATGLGTDSAPTAHTADTGPPTALPDSVVAFQLTEPQCLVEVEIPSGTITPVTCGPKGTSFFRWPRLVPDDRGVFPVEGADVVGVAVVQRGMHLQRRGAKPVTGQLHWEPHRRVLPRNRRHCLRAAGAV